jgi:hypothetical protein
MPPAALFVRYATICVGVVAVQATTPLALAEQRDPVDPWAQIRPAPDAAAQDSEREDTAAQDTAVQASAAQDAAVENSAAEDPTARGSSALPAPPPVPPVQASTAQISPPPQTIAKPQDPAFTSRKDNKDGSALVTAGTKIPADLQTKVGVDLGLAPPPSQQPAPVAYLQSGPAVQDGSSGAAWANLTLPGSPLPLAWDKTSLDARLDPLHEQSRIGSTLSRTLRLGDSVSMTLQNGYAVTQSLANTPPVQQPFDPMAISPRPGTGAPTALPAPQIWSNDDVVRLSLSSTGTTFSVGTKVQSTDDRWLPSLSAEQKLFNGPVSVTGAITERPAGDANKSIMAGFKQTW